MLIDCCPSGTRRAAVDLDFKRRRSKRGSIAGEDQSSLPRRVGQFFFFVRPSSAQWANRSLGLDRGRAISESRHGTTCCYYTSRRLLYRLRIVDPDIRLQVGDREPLISSASQPLTCTYGTLLYQGYGSYPTIHPFAFDHYSHGPPDHLVMLSESIFQNARCRSGLPTLAFSLSS
jgi:hypothetical protein